MSTTVTNALLDRYKEISSERDKEMNKLSLITSQKIDTELRISGYELQLEEIEAAIKVVSQLNEEGA